MGVSQHCLVSVTPWTCGKVHLHAVPHMRQNKMGGHLTHVLEIFTQEHLSQHSRGFQKSTWGNVSWWWFDLNKWEGRVRTSPSTLWERQFWKSFVFLGALAALWVCHAWTLRCLRKQLPREEKGGRGVTLAGDSCAVWKFPVQWVHWVSLKS